LKKLDFSPESTVEGALTAEAKILAGCYLLTYLGLRFRSPRFQPLLPPPTGSLLPEDNDDDDVEVTANDDNIPSSIRHRPKPSRVVSSSTTAKTLNPPPRPVHTIMGGMNQWWSR